MNPLLTEILDISPDRPLSEQRMQQLASQYPAFTLPALMSLKAQGGTPQLAARVAIALPSIDAYSDIMGEDADILANFYSVPEKATPSTMETIDTFLATYGTPADSRETDALEKAIFNPVPDYGAMLAAEEKNSIPEGEELDANVVGSHTAAINRFIASSKKKTQKPEERPQPVAVSETNDAPAPEEAPKPEAEIIAHAPAADTPTTESAVQAQKPSASGNLSESFARIMIKNGNYIKALEIISDLYLKNPEKSVYFADQIRFLRKLIVNENKKQ